VSSAFTKEEVGFLCSSWTGPGSGQKEAGYKHLCC